MTVSNETNRTSAVGTGAEQIVPFTFPITKNSDIVVTSRVISTGVETLLSETTDYTVDNNGSSGGSITTVTPFVASTSQVHVVRDTPNTQLLDLVQGGEFSAERVESALDKNAKLTIENVDGLDRTLKFPTTDPASSFSDMPNSIDRANKNLTFDSTGKPTASVSVEEDSVSFTPIGEDIAGAANAASVRDIIELDTDDDVEFAGITGTTGTFSGAVSTTTLTASDIITKSPWFDIRAYGAGTGETGATNATAIQAAIDAAELVGGTVFFPPGVYETNAQLNVDAAVSIWGPGATIKQSDSSNLTVVLKVDVATLVDITLFIKIDGNMDNNTAIEGFVLNGIKLSHGLIDITATECDTGIVIEGRTEANTLLLKAFNCTIGVLERIDSGNTPDENTLFVNGHANVTHYKKESNDDRITSSVHLGCEASTGYAVILEGGDTTLNGVMRGCAAGGVMVTGDEDVASIHVQFNELKLRSSGSTAGWGLIVDEATLSGSVNIHGFAGGFWVKECDQGRLMVHAVSAATLPAIRLGDTGSTTAQRFTVNPGSYASCTTGPALHMSQTSYCDVNLQQIAAGSGDEIEFETTASRDTLRLMGGNTLSIERNSTDDHVIEYYGQRFKTLNDTGTPSVQGSDKWITGGTRAITFFDDGFESQVITIASGHTVTITHSTAIVLSGGANFVMASGDTLTLMAKADGNWYEIARGDNS